MASQCVFLVLSSISICPKCHVEDYTFVGEEHLTKYLKSLFVWGEACVVYIVYIVYFQKTCSSYFGGEKEHLLHNLNLHAVQRNLLCKKLSLLGVCWDTTLCIERENGTIFLSMCSLNFYSQGFILKNFPARWKLMKNTFSEEELVRCSSRVPIKVSSLSPFQHSMICSDK